MIHCDACRAPLHLFVILDSEVWEQIARDDYALCAECIDGRLKELGIKAKCALQLVGLASLKSEVTPWVDRSGAWRPRELVALQGEGLPGLYRRES